MPTSSVLAECELFSMSDLGDELKKILGHRTPWATRFGARSCSSYSVIRSSGESRGRLASMGFNPSLAEARSEFEEAADCPEVKEPRGAKGGSRP